MCECECVNVNVNVIQFCKIFIFLGVSETHQKWPEIKSPQRKKFRKKFIFVAQLHRQKNSQKLKSCEKPSENMPNARDMPRPCRERSGHYSSQNRKRIQ